MVLINIDMLSWVLYSVTMQHYFLHMTTNTFSDALVRKDDHDMFSGTDDMVAYETYSNHF